MSGDQKSPPSEDLDREIAELAPRQDDPRGRLARRALRRALLGKDDEPPPTIGRFELRGILGEGGMGVVYDAHDPRLQRDVALKVIPARGDDDDRLLAEARALAKLSHPHVIAVHEAQRLGDDVVIAMERIDGQDLRHWLGATPASWQTIVHTLLGAGQGLASAHQAGLVHRDVKPENILVGRDGRARIGDFGLARPAGELPLAHGSGPAPEGTAGTGTPAYMAPEQQRGRPADVGSDLYSFCLTVSEALGGSVPPGPVAPRAPAAVRRILARGLAVSLEERPASMPVLLAELTRAFEAPRRRRRAVWSVSALAALVVPLVWLTTRSSPVATCERAVRPATSVWNADRRARVEAAFVRSRSPLAGDMARRVSDRLDRFAATFPAAVRETCAAAGVRAPSETTGNLVELRLLCLSRALNRVDALVGALATADAAMVLRAPTAVDAAADVAACAQTETVAQPHAPPPDPVVSARVRAVRTQLDRAEALELAGRYQAGLEVVRAALSEAEATGYAPLLAEAWYRLGVLERYTDDVRAGKVAFARAATTAETVGEDLVSARAWIRLISAARALAQYDEADGYAEQARAKLERIGDPPEELAFWHVNVGELARARGDLAAARQRFERALALYEPFGANRPRIVSLLGSLADVYFDLGERSLARDTAERALVTAENLYGADHPELVSVLQRLATAKSYLGHYDEALGLLERGLAIAERVHGPTSSQVAAVLNDVAHEHLALGAGDRAKSALERALAIREATLGPDHPDVARVLLNLAQVLLADEPEVAAQRLERALAIARARLAPAHPMTANILHQLGRAEHAQADRLAAAGRTQEARNQILAAIASHEEALRRYKEIFGPRHPKVAMAATGLGDALLAASRPGEAAVWLDEALAIPDRTPLDVAQCEFALAKALWRSSGPKRRARELARHAEETLRAQEGTPARALVADVSAWRRAPQ